MLVLIGHNIFLLIIFYDDLIYVLNDIIRLITFLKIKPINQYVISST